MIIYIQGFFNLVFFCFLNRAFALTEQEFAILPLIITKYKNNQHKDHFF